MVGIVVVTHSSLGDTLIQVAKSILKDQLEAVISVSIDLNQNADKLRKKIDQAIKKANRNQGILILTDMFGGTPSNISYSFLEEGRVEVLAGVNLPILITALSNRTKMDFSEFVANLEILGKESILIGTKILKGNKTR